MCARSDLELSPPLLTILLHRQTIYFWCVTHYADPQIIAYSPWVSHDCVDGSFELSADPSLTQSFTAEPILTGFMAAVSAISGRSTCDWS